MDRRRRSPCWGTIWLVFLSLIVFWHYPLDGARAEAPGAWRINDLSAHVGMVKVSKDIAVFYYKEQQPFMTRACNDVVHFPLVNCEFSSSFLSRPIGRNRWRPNVFSTFGYDLLDSAAQIAIVSKDDADRGVTSACTRGCSWSATKISEMVTENRGSTGIYFGRKSSGRQLAVYRMSGQPEIDRANVGTELPLFGVHRGIGLVAGSVGEPTRVYRSPGDNGSSYGQSPSRPGKYSHPLNKLPLIIGVIIILLAYVLCGKAFETLFFLSERKHGLPIVIFGFLGAIGCAALGTFLIVRLT